MNANPITAWLLGVVLPVLLAGCGSLSLQTGDHWVEVAEYRNEWQAEGVDTTGQAVFSNCCGLILTEMTETERTSVVESVDDEKAGGASEEVDELAALLDSPRPKRLNGSSYLRGSKAQATRFVNPQALSDVGMADIDGRVALKQASQKSGDQSMIIAAKRELDVSVTPSRDKLLPGQTVWFTIRVTNKTNKALKAVRLSLDTHQRFHYLRHLVRYDRTRWNRSIQTHTSPRPGRLHWDIGPVLNPGETVMFHVQMELEILQESYSSHRQIASK